VNGAATAAEVFFGLPNAKGKALATMVIGSICHEGRAGLWLQRPGFRSRPICRAPRNARSWPVHHAACHRSPDLFDRGNKLSANSGAGQKRKEFSVS